MYFISDTNRDNVDGIYMENYMENYIDKYINMDMDIKFIDIMKKIKLHDINSNIKIKILKIINQNTKKGNYLLCYLGYNIYNSDKIILKCRYLLKSNFFNKKFNDYLLIFINYSGNIVIYKYLILKNNEKKYKYVCVMYNQDSNLDSNQDSN